ncbi:hypothetical protein MKW94_026723 [Papaver nudicaule]|uniref:Uncharacterized protein n=1 Tax=Papaver nudicaule TaxID=74823 RepID=A0AA41V3E6_PAPNU|nr:hypothetical protein [Papaver nudicaule]
MTFASNSPRCLQNSKVSRKKVILKRTARISVKQVNLLPVFNRTVVNTHISPAGPSSRMIPASPVYTPSSPSYTPSSPTYTPSTPRESLVPVNPVTPPYKKSLNELFNGITAAEVTPNLLLFPVKPNGDSITEEDSAIIDPNVAIGLADSCLLP